MDFIKRDLLNIMSKKNFTIEQFCIWLHEEDLASAFETLNEYFKENYEELVKDRDFMKEYFSCINVLCDKVNEENDRLVIMRHADILETLAGNYCKPYNKKEKKKDIYFVTSKEFKNSAQSTVEFLANRIINSDKKFEKYRIMEFIIFTLKNPDYLFRILQVESELINVRSSDNKHLFTVISETYLNNVKKLSVEQLKYYKRIIMMMLESDELSLKNKEISELLELAKKTDRNNENKDTKFFVNAINVHYPNLNGSERITTVDHTLMEAPSILISSKGMSNDRVDLTKAFTLSIDGNRNGNLGNVLFDDAFSLQQDGSGVLHLLIHIPDVDTFIESDCELDKYMRHLSQSVYAYGFKKPLINYDIASYMSLKQGVVRPAITFDITMDNDANIKGINFYKSLVNVNYNLTKDKADQFIKFGTRDERLGVLKKMMDLMTKSARKRKEKTGGRSGAKIIMDEVNTLPNLVTAQYALDNGIPFAYKNYLGKRKAGSAKHVSEVDQFIQSEHLDEESSELVKSIFDIYNRVFYDTINLGNASYHGAPCGTVGNPLREYISLESDRLISDLLINNLGNYDYWRERIERDVVEYTETSAKLQELYGLKRGR